METEQINKFENNEETEEKLASLSLDKDIDIYLEQWSEKIEKLNIQINRIELDNRENLIKLKDLNKNRTEYEKVLEEYKSYKLLSYGDKFKKLYT